MKVTKEQFIGVTYDELLAENAKLREEFDKMDVWHSKELSAAMAENAKLRKLVVKMFHTIEWSDRMSDSMYWPSFFYERELRELGIEAGDGVS